MGNSVHILTPVRKGGPWKWGAMLADHLNKRGGWNVKHIHLLPEVLLSPLYQRCDIVHTTIPITYRLWRKPTILTIRGDYRRDKNIWSGMYPRAIKMADVVTVPSCFLRDTLGIKEAIVIPPAVEVLGRGQGEGGQKRFKDKVQLLTVTNFHFPGKAKGVLKILEVVSMLRFTDLKFSISILGDGQYRKEVEAEAIKSGIEVKFHGFADPQLFMRAADIFVYWSYHDNTPIALLEAMSYGMPVITNDVGAVSELMEHGKNGFIAKDEEEYGGYLRILLSDPYLRDNFGKAARKTVMEKFHHDVITPHYEALYREFI